MAKIKQLLTLLGSFAIIGAAATTISCGVSLKTLENRTIDNSTFKTIFNSSIQNWNMPASMQSVDLKVLANTQDTLMTYTKDDLDKPTGLLIDESNDDGSKEFKVTLKNSAKWFNSTTGKFVRNITGQDLINSGLYILDSANGAETSKDWIQFIAGALAYKNSDHKDEAKAKFIETAFKYSKDNPNELTYNLTKNAGQFRTALVSPSFAPMPEEALKEGFQYGRPDYKNVLFSGPYYIPEPNNWNKFFDLKRNKNYDNQFGNIETIRYYKTPNKDWGSVRGYFETGDINEAQLSPSDEYGWNKYMGDDRDNPKFDKVQKVDNNQIGLKNLLFNYVNTESNESNVALSYNDVRSWIAYAMDRSQFTKFFSGPYDEKHKDDYLVNTLNPIYDTNYLKEEYTDKLVDQAKAYGDTSKLKMGNDFYYKNPKLIGERDELKIISDIRKELKLDTSQKVELTMLTSGDNETTFNPYIEQMLDKFNAIKDNPIKIVQKKTMNDDDYQLAQQKGNYSMFITGWGPNYLDPMAFLQSQEFDGGMASYMGYTRLQGTDKTPAASFNNVEAIKGEIGAYTKELDDAALNDDYSGYAKAEADLLYNYKLSIPLYKPNGNSVYYLSYLNQYSKTNKGFGNGDYRFENVISYKSLKDIKQTKPKIKDQPVIKEN